MNAIDILVEDWNQELARRAVGLLIERQKLLDDGYFTFDVKNINESQISAFNGLNGLITSFYENLLQMGIFPLKLIYQEDKQTHKFKFQLLN